jgi:transcriptional regulator with XRE-family HTH domain
MSFAAKVKELRLRSGKSLQELADAIGVSKAHIWDMENGNSKNPSADVLKKLSDYFKVSVAYFFGEEAGDDDELKVMFRQLQELGPEERALVLAIMETQKKLKGQKDGAD